MPRPCREALDVMTTLEELQGGRPVRPGRVPAVARRALTKDNVSKATLQIAGALYIAQRGECFHCPGALPLFAGRRRDFACSREHVLPQGQRTGTARQDGAFVLAHTLCNRERGDRPLTAVEWEFAGAAWRNAMGLWIGSGNPFPAWIDMANEKQKEST